MRERSTAQRAAGLSSRAAGPARGVGAPTYPHSLAKDSPFRHFRHPDAHTKRAAR